MTQEKRRKITDESSLVKTTRSAKPSRIFSPFRVLGNVSNETPFAIGTLGTTFYIVTSVGRSFQIYDANSLHLLFVSTTQTSSKITALTAHFHYVYAAYANKIGIYKRGILEHTLEVESEDLNPINNLIVFGDYLVASTTNSVNIFKKSNGLKVATEFYTKIPINKIDGDVVSILHPPTYLNKIVIATTTNLLVVNVKTGKILFTSNIFPVEITTIEMAPVLDILAIGNVKGQVMLYNIKKGKILRVIETGEQNRISTLSFRTDGSPHIAVGLNNGDLLFYDLNRKVRIHIMKGIHKEAFGGIANAKFLNGQPIIVTNGADNQLKEHVFDPSLSTTNTAIVSPPRYLRSRGGHSAPPTSIRFADEDSHFILSGSKDHTFWSFSLRKDAQSQEISQRNHKKANGRSAGPTVKEKFPEILDIAIENIRAGEWENVLTAHKDEKFARTWNSKTKRVGRHVLNTIDDGSVKSVAISQCGNFGLVGSSNGGIGVYNLQSGIARKNYKLHKKAVTGIAIDGMNRKMVSVGLDGVVGFYDFSKSVYLGKLQLNAPITLMVYHRSSDLVALALDDLSIVVIDAVTQKVIRILWGHSNRITAMDFSSDGRWIISASLDSTIRTWDLPTGGCIDGIKVAKVVTNLKMSPLGDYLATTHVNSNGISLWVNRSQFITVSTRHIEEDEFLHAILPNDSGDGGSNILDGALNNDEAEVDQDSKHSIHHYETLDQIDSSLMTLSLQPRNKLNTLINLDTIKQRNKPKEAPKKPENAPFFLQLTGEKIGDEAAVREGAVKSSNSTDNNQTEETEDSLNPLKPVGSVNFESTFTRLLREGSVSQEFTEFLTYLSNASPSVTDLEIKSINTQPPLTEISSFIDALTQGYKQNQNVELIEAWLNMLLKNHGDVIKQIPDEKLSNSLKKWYEVHESKTDSFDDLVKYCSSVINLLSSV